MAAKIEACVRSGAGFLVGLGLLEHEAVGFALVAIALLSCPYVPPI